MRVPEGGDHMTGPQAIAKANEVLFPEFTVGTVAAALLEAQAAALEDEIAGQGHTDDGDGPCRGWCPACSLRADVATLRSEAEVCRGLTT